LWAPFNLQGIFLQNRVSDNLNNMDCLHEASQQLPTYGIS